jgi:hypothetical protein
MYGFCFVVGVMYHIKTSWLDATNVSAWMVVIVVRLNESSIQFSLFFRLAMVTMMTIPPLYMRPHNRDLQRIYTGCIYLEIKKVLSLNFTSNNIIGSQFKCKCSNCIGHFDPNYLFHIDVLWSESSNTLRTWKIIKLK